MAIAKLRTDYETDEIEEAIPKRKYQITNNSDGSVCIDDVTKYTKKGSDFDADDINTTNRTINQIIDAIESDSASSSGDTSSEGYSVTANVKKVGNATTITITDKNGTTTETIYDGEDGDTGPQGPQGIQGSKGDPGENGSNGQDGKDGIDGFSPIITEDKNNSDDIYKLKIVTKTNTFTTPNLKGPKGDPGENDDAVQVLNTAIANKADKTEIPTVGNGKIIIKQGGIKRGEFTTNQSSDTIIELNNEISGNGEISVTSGTPIGEIISYMGITAPQNYLICDGTEYQIEDYPYLAQHFLDNFGLVNFFGGNGNTTFAVPDLRGEFLRGAGTASRNTGSGAAVGAHQNATVHPNVYLSTANYLTVREYGALSNPDKTSNTSSTRGLSCSKITGQDNAKEYTSRPTNTSVLYCIKYK